MENEKNSIIEALVNQNKSQNDSIQKLKISISNFNNELNNKQQQAESMSKNDKAEISKLQNEIQQLKSLKFGSFNRSEIFWYQEVRLSNCGKGMRLKNLTCTKQLKLTVSQCYLETM